MGLRNRLAVLSEATCYLPFRQRVATTRDFVLTVLEEISDRQEHILRLTRGADARVIGWGLNPETAPALTIHYKIASHGTEEILLEKPTSAAGSSRARRIAPPQEFMSVKMQVYDRFETTETARFPAAYFIPSTFNKAVELLRRHGVVVERLLAAWKGPAEAFVIDEIISAERPFQGHVLKELQGHFGSTQVEIPEGGYLVRTAQPLGILIFHLLEPKSIDGVAARGFLDPALHPEEHYPIHKCFDKGHVATERQPGY